MTKKFVIIAGIIALAALAAGLVAFFLTRNKAIAQVLEEDDEMLLDFDEEILSV
ncbi:MAG: hypothetical protein IJO91_03485 [Oscillospiraceae bacterium]|nr:hypothetical protein [Oscillospiraceae bacterium]